MYRIALSWSFIVICLLEKCKVKKKTDSNETKGCNKAITRIDYVKAFFFFILYNEKPLRIKQVKSIFFLWLHLSISRFNKPPGHWDHRIVFFNGRPIH